MKNPLEPLAAIAAPVKDITELLNKFLSPALQEAGEVVGARIRVFRLKQETKLLEKSISILKEAGLKPRPVNLRVLFPLLDAAVLEEDDQMAERWASLLASAADPNNETDLEASFIEILKQLTPTHAYLLDVFYEQIERDELPPKDWLEEGYVLSDLKSFLKEEVPQFDIALDNLLRLNLVAYPMVKLGIANGEEVRISVPSSNILCATNLGQAFVSACKRGRTPRNISYGVPSNSVTNHFWTRGGSLNITPAPPAKAIPPGPIPEDLRKKIEMEALEIAKKIPGVQPGVALMHRTLKVVFYGQHLQQLPNQTILPLTEFCAERGLAIEFHYGVMTGI
jgi:hypothetical protein